MTGKSTSPRGGCAHIFDDGRKCGAFAIRGSDRCIAHTDAEIRMLASRRMKAAKRRSYPQSIDQILEGSEWDLRTVSHLVRLVMRDVHSGKITPTIGHCLTALGNVALRALEKGELEDRLERLEKATEIGNLR